MRNRSRFELPAALVLVALTGGALGDSYVVNELCETHRSDTFRQLVRFQTVDKDPRRLVVENQERERAVDAWTKTELTLSASFQIRDVWAVKADELFVWGHTDAGENVVERWVLHPLAGAMTVERSIDPTAPGTPREATGFVERVVGGAWIQPALRKGRTWVDRTELHRGGRARLLQVDPDGRHVLLATVEPPAIVRVDLLEPGPPEVLFTEEQVPGLAHGMCTMTELGPSGWVEPHYHGPGRAFLLSCIARDAQGGLDLDAFGNLFLVDADNDGLFESLGPEPPVSEAPASEPRADGRVPLRPR